MSFPLPFVPAQSYKTGGRRFGARRDGGKRQHAGCDLIAPAGTEIYAVDSGVVIRGPYPFYHGTYALEIQHGHFLVRYCEIRGAAQGISTGTTVMQGQLIAYVGRMYTSSMLHFEMYRGTEGGPLTQRGNPPFQRRADLFDPTVHLDHWSNYLLMSHANVSP
jgi:murein DD-endopeptidase MepM/ murein hydrolase activator NlpD